jgi:hypothetical protein
MVFNSVQNIYYNAGGGSLLPVLLLPDINGLNESVAITAAANIVGADSLNVDE